MIRRDQPYQAADWIPDAELQSILSAQRAALEEAFLDNWTKPAVGDIWVSAAQWSSGPEDRLAAMLVVLRAFSEGWSSRPLFDVAPVSEDERLASEWSLVLSASDSGVGLPLVLHVDVQCTTTSSMLTRRVGSLSYSARLDLQDLVRAYAMGDASSIEWRVGRPGRLSIRFHPEWEDFSKQLLTLSKAFAAALASERRQEPAGDAGESIDSDHRRLLAVASGEHKELKPPQRCTWEYRNVSPFVYCGEFTHKGVPRLLGEAIAHYYLQRSAAKGVCTVAPQQLDGETFRHLMPLLDAPLAPLLNNTDLHKALRELVGEHAVNALRDRMSYAIVVESIRCAKKSTGLTTGAQPMRLAARRPSKD